MKNARRWFFLVIVLFIFLIIGFLVLHRTPRSHQDESVPVEIVVGDLIVPKGEERTMVAESITVEQSFSIEGTLRLSLPSGATTDTIELILPEKAEIAGTILVEMPKQATVSRLKQFLLPTPVLAVSAPQPGTNIAVRQPPAGSITLMSTARIITPRGADAPDETVGSIVYEYRGAEGGRGGDITLSTSGYIIFQVLEANRPLEIFEPGNGGKGASVVIQDQGWQGGGVEKMIIRAGWGGRSGGVFLYGQQVRIQDPVNQPLLDSYTLRVRDDDGGGDGGNGGDVLWTVKDAALQGVTDIELYGGVGGGGIRFGGQGGTVQYLAGKPIVSKENPSPIRVLVRGGRGGHLGLHLGYVTDDGPLENRVPTELARMPQVIEPRPVHFSGYAGNGGSIGLVAHNGWDGTREHPDGYEPGPVEVEYGNGGYVVSDRLFSGTGGNGAGMIASQPPLVGGNGGAGFSFCDTTEEKKGGDGGRSGHLSIHVGAGSNGTYGGAAGNVFYEHIEVGTPGKGGDGSEKGAAGFFGKPLDSIFDPRVNGDPSAYIAFEHFGLRVTGGKGGRSRRVGENVPYDPLAEDEGYQTVFSGDYVEPERVDGKKCAAREKPVKKEEGVFHQQVTLVAKTYLPKYAQVTMTVEASANIHMDCFDSPIYCDPIRFGLWTARIETRDGIKTYTGAINADGSLMPDSSGFTPPAGVRSPFHFVSTPGYYCTNQGKLATPWSLPGHETETVYYSDGSSEVSADWSFTGQVAPKEAWPKRLINTNVCCVKNPPPLGVPEGRYQPTYSPATTRNGDTSACVDGPIRF